MHASAAGLLWSDSVPDMSSAKRRLLQSLVEQSARESDRLHEHLVKMASAPSDAESALTVVLVHPVGGTIFCYAALAVALGPYGDVLGIPARLELLRSVEVGGTVALANVYAQLLTEHRPTGALIIGGWSYGGVIAWEIACILATERERNPPTVLLIDSALSAEPQQPISDGELFASFAADIFRTYHRGAADGASAGHSISFDELAEHVGLELPTLHEHYEIYRLNMLAAVAHVTTRAAVPGLAIVAERSLLGDLRHVLHRSVDIVLVDSDHYSVVDAPETVLRATELAADVRSAEGRP